MIEGKPADARRVVEQLEAFGEKGYVPAASQGAAYAAIGDFEASLDWFERAVDDYNARIHFYLPRNPLYPLPDELAETQRFHDLLKRLRFDEETLNILPLN